MNENDMPLSGLEQNIESQIQGVVETSPAAPVRSVPDVTPTPAPVSSIQAQPAPAIEPEVTMLGNGIKLKRTPAQEGTRIKLRQPEAPDSVVETPYDANRISAMHPAVQDQSGAFITNNPADVYIGGRVPKNARIYAEYPGESNTFFVKQKFDPVKPYPLTMASGEKFEVETANLNKAAWLFAATREPTRPIDWYGYYRLPEVTKEGAVHAVVRGVVNAIPGSIAGAAGGAAALSMDAVYGLGKLFDSQKMVDFANKMRPVVLQTAQDLVEDVTWQYGPDGLGDAHANRFWNIGGQVLGWVPLGYLGGMAAMPLLATMEGLDSALTIRQAMEDKGVSVGKAAMMSLGGGLGVTALGLVPAGVSTLTRATMKPARGFTYLAMKEPAELRRLLGRQALISGMFEGPSEASQDLFTQWVAGEPITPENWQDALSTLFWAALIGAGSATLDARNAQQQITGAAAAVKDVFDAHQDVLKEIVAASQGAVTEQNINEIFAAIASPEVATDFINTMKEAVIANFDKVSPEDKKTLMDKVRQINPDTSLEAEFAALDQRIDELLSGETGLTEGQKALAKLMLRGTAAQQLVNLGILPSQMVLPERISGTLPETIADPGKVAGYHEDGSIYVNEQLASNPQTPTRATRVPVGTSNRTVSRRVFADYTNAIVSGTAQNIARDRSQGIGSLSHEFWHWIEQNTGLPGVGAYMQQMSSLVESVIPGYLEGKSGVELSEAYAYAMQYADRGVKESLGLAGKTSDYLDFMNSALNAESIAQTTSADMSAYMKSLQDVLKTNKVLVDDILTGFGTDQLKGAIDNFIKTGDLGSVPFDTLRELNAVLGSAVNADTGNKMAEIFETPAKIDAFMQRYANQYDNLMAADAEAIRAQREANRKVADQKVGLDPKKTPADIETSETKMAEVVADDQTDTPSRRRVNPRSENPQYGNKYDIDALMSGEMENDPAYLTDYRLAMNRWLKNIGRGGEDLSKYNVNVMGAEVPGAPNTIELTPSTGKTKDDHIIAYNVLSSVAVAKLKKEGKFNTEQQRRLREEGLYAVADNIRSIYNGEPMEYLADRVANDQATADEVELYTALSRFDHDLSDIYQEFGPYTPEDNAIRAMQSAQTLMDTLQFLQGSQDESVRAILNGHFGDTAGRYTFNAEVERALGNYVSGKSVIETLDAYINHLSDYVNDMEAARAWGERTPDIAPTPVNRALARARGVIDSPKTSQWQKDQATRVIARIGQEAADRNNPMNKYFTPDYNADYSERYTGVQTLTAASAFLHSRGGTAEERAGARELMREDRVLSTYTNPVRGYLRRDTINSPTPLEELGISTEDARAQVIAAGLEPFEFETVFITNDFIGRRLNSPDSGVVYATRRSVLAKLLEQVPSIGTTEDPGERMRILLAISDAKALADSMFASYLSREDTFNNRPTIGEGITEISINFMLSERGQRNMKMHKEEMGYSEAALASDLRVSDEIAFPYGNNMFRGVVSFRGRTPAGKLFYIIREAVDLNNWRQKDLTTQKSGLRELVLSADDMRQVGILRKPAGTQDYDYIAQLFDFFDKAYEVMGRKNYTRIAEETIAEVAEDRKLKQIAMRYGTEFDPNENTVENLEEEGFYSVSDVTADPGAFVDGFYAAGEKTDYDDIFRSETPFVLDEDLIEYAKDSGIVDEKDIEALKREYIEWAKKNGIPEAQMSENLRRFTADASNRLYEDLRRQNEARKLKFSEAMNRKVNGSTFLETIKSMTDGVKGRKINKLLLGMGWGSTLDRKLRMIFGPKIGAKVSSFVNLASKAQSASEGQRRVLDSAMLTTVFKGSRRAYERWLTRKGLDEFDAQLYNGLSVKVSRGEIIGMYMAKQAMEKGYISAAEYGNIEARMRKFYTNFDELLGHLTEEDISFAENVAPQMLDSLRAEGSAVPAFWTPSIDGDQYIKNGWENRKKGSPDNSIDVVASDSPLAATDVYDSIVTMIGNNSLKMSGMGAALQRLDNMLTFADVDRSQYQPFDAEDEALFREILTASATLRDELQRAVGKYYSKWLVDNIRTDLKFNPAWRDIASNPALNAFQKVTRTVATGLLSLNLKQGFNNLGNYHMFLGLSDSSMAKFYTADWLNAAAHFREAWELAIGKRDENGEWIEGTGIEEFRRRLEQAGLSEQMRRVADMKGDSLLRDLQEAMYKRGKDKAGDIAGMVDTFSKVSAKYGLATNVLPDIVGIALGTYAVWNDVLRRNGGSVAKTKAQITEYILNRVSSSNYMARSGATKMLNKMGLEALVMFQNDQLQKVGMLAEGIMTLQNSQDPEERRRAWKDIEASTYSTLRYVAIQAGWVSALIRIMTGDDLSDEEEEYLMDATLREVISQIGGTSQFGNFFVPILNALVEGKTTGLNFVPTASVQRLATSAHKGDWLKAVAELVALTGITPLAPSAVRIMDGMAKLASDDELEQKVGTAMLFGRSEATAEDMLGLSRSQKTKKLRPKKSNKTSDEK